MTPAAAQAMNYEWERLRRKYVWDETVIREWADVAREARDNAVPTSFHYQGGHKGLSVIA